ncbi:DUF397 domain-containing protein [Nocardiopsis quinghaiensis]|uniref:DUF397 domain-containing protein n=1 Tax=Nocardiopsis quinghaiensis TaxID=464995 RepID=UPI0012395527|nr:DUF397 domain-containing protein [Nocardiopsis quinghaiensis]
MNPWHKATYSENSSHCVEVCERQDGADVRDTQNRELGHLSFGRREWTSLVTLVTGRK